MVKKYQLYLMVQLLFAMLLLSEPNGVYVSLIIAYVDYYILNQAILIEEFLQLLASLFFFFKKNLTVITKLHIIQFSIIVVNRFNSFIL